MPRRAGVTPRAVLPDPVYSNMVVTKLINQVMHDGNKGTAQRVCYDAFNIVQNKTGRDPIEVFEQAINNIMPVLEVKARRVGGSTYQVPIEVRPVRRQTLGIRWLVSFARDRNERTMSERLAGEIIDAAGGGGNAVKRKEDMHRMAEANRAFAHYRW
ncbi:MAG: 30S ribosomal protein S7 [Clostridiales bacterium]|nr:30S ribosomal protein S7 [Clostridiales bacterium]